MYYSMLMDLFTDKVCDKILRHTSPAEWDPFGKSCTCTAVMGRQFCTLPIKVTPGEHRRWNIRKGARIRKCAKKWQWAAHMTGMGLAFSDPGPFAGLLWTMAFLISIVRIYDLMLYLQWKYFRTFSEIFLKIEYILYAIMMVSIFRIFLENF